MCIHQEINETTKWYLPSEAHLGESRQFKGFVLSTGPSSQDYVMQKNLSHFGSMAHELGMARGAID